MDKLIAAANGKSAVNGGLNVPEIKAYLASRGLSTAGTSPQLRARLLEALGEQPPVANQVAPKIAVKPASPKPVDKVAKQVPKLVVKPASPGPVKKPVTKPVVKPASKPVVKPASKPVVKPKATYESKPGNIVPGVVPDSMLKNGRLSAGEYYRTFGVQSIGDICDIRGDGELKCLVPRSGSAFWSSPTKTENVMSRCGPVPWRKKCRL